MIVLRDVCVCLDDLIVLACLELTGWPHKPNFKFMKRTGERRKGKRTGRKGKRKGRKMKENEEME